MQQQHGLIESLSVAHFVYRMWLCWLVHEPARIRPLLIGAAVICRCHLLAAHSVGFDRLLMMTAMFGRYSFC
jgi:hypothetical protein